MTRWFCALMLLLTGCMRGGSPSQPPAYTVGPAWQGAKGVWFYPQEQFALVETGLAVVASDDHADQTADHENFDQTALAAGHQTLQLPAIVRVTDLRNGRSILVRVNDRGPADPGRVIELTQRAAQLLDIPPQGTAEVRIEVQEAESRAVAEKLAPAIGPKVVAVPAGEVRQSDLAPPDGGGAAPVQAAALAAADPGGLPALPSVPDRLTESVTQGTAQAGRLALDAGTFSQLRFAQERVGKLRAGNPHVERTRTGRGETFRVVSGPYANVADADRALDQALAAGVPDARIVVE